MEKPTFDQQEIRNLEAAISVWKNRFAKLEKERDKMQIMIEIQGDEINAWKDRFDSLLGLKGDK